MVIPGRMGDACCFAVVRTERGKLVSLPPFEALADLSPYRGSCQACRDDEACQLQAFATPPKQFVR